MVAPWERFRLANTEPVDDRLEASTGPAEPVPTHVGGSCRNGQDQLRRRAAIRSGCGSPVRPSTSSVDGGLVSIHHRGVLVATHARATGRPRSSRALRRGRRTPSNARPRPTSTVGQSVTRKVDSRGQRELRRHQLPRRHKLTSAARSKSRSSATPSRSPSARQLIRTHPIRHDRTREHGALANPGGRPRRINAA